MILERCKDQIGSIEKFYQKIAAESENGDAALAMLALIEKLRASPPEDRAVWCLTSLHRLCLLSSNSSDTKWYVDVAALNESTYFIEYRMPDGVAPWPEARVRGEAKSLDEALKMTLIGLEKSEGWK